MPRFFLDHLTKKRLEKRVVLRSPVSSVKMSLILFIFISFRESTRREWGGEAFRWSGSSIADRTCFHFSVFFSFVQVSWYERRHGMFARILPPPCLVWDNFRLVYPPSDSECDSSGNLTQFHLSIVSVRFVGVLFAVYIFCSSTAQCGSDESLNSSIIVLLQATFSSHWMCSVHAVA